MRRNLAVLGLAFVTLAIPARGGVDAARERLEKHDPAGAILEYESVASRSADAALVAEYAYALAEAGFVELSLAELDRALLMDAASDDVLFFSARILGLLGMKDVAKELNRNTPSWFSKGAEPVAAVQWHPKVSNFTDLMERSNAFMDQGRYASAAAYLHQATQIYSDQSDAWSAYGVTLDKLGAFHMASQAVKSEIVLASADRDLSPEEGALLKSYATELGTRAPVAPVKFNESLGGRYFTFFGGGVNGTTVQTTVNVTARVGKFFTNYLSTDFSTGFLTGAGFIVGLSGRFHQPLPIDAPLNVSFGSRIDYNTGAAANNFGFTLSPGLTWFIAKSDSVDLFFDIPLLGALKGTQTLSLGYTHYF